MCSITPMDYLLVIVLLIFYNLSPFKIALLRSFLKSINKLQSLGFFLKFIILFLAHEHLNDEHHLLVPRHYHEPLHHPTGQETMWINISNQKFSKLIKKNHTTNI